MTYIYINSPLLELYGNHTSQVYYIVLIHVTNETLAHRNRWVSLWWLKWVLPNWCQFGYPLYVSISKVFLFVLNWRNACILRFELLRMWEHLSLLKSNLSGCHISLMFQWIHSQPFFFFFFELILVNSFLSFTLPYARLISFIALSSSFVLGLYIGNSWQCICTITVELGFLFITNLVFENLKLN